MTQKRKCATCKTEVDYGFYFNNGDFNCGDCYFLRAEFRAVGENIFPYGPTSRPS